MKGFGVIELIVAIAILGMAAAIVALNVGDFIGRTDSNHATHNVTLNVTEDHTPFTICIDGECLVCNQWHVIGGDSE